MKELSCPEARQRLSGLLETAHKDVCTSEVVMGRCCAAWDERPIVVTRCGAIQ